MNMSKFLRGYVECALWSSTDDNDMPLDRDHGIEDISTEALASMQEDCTAFEQDNREDLEHAGNDEQNGHDFWLTRNRHGAGFWDRGYRPEVGKRLTDAAHVYGSSDLYVGDDGKPHIS